MFRSKYASMDEFESTQVCRLCLGEGDGMIYIFDQKGFNGFRVWEVIKELLQLEISKEDGLPRTACPKCLNKVTEFKKFKAVCINAKISFLEMIATRGMVTSCAKRVSSVPIPKPGLMPNFLKRHMNCSVENSDAVEIVEDSLQIIGRTGSEEESDGCAPGGRESTRKRWKGDGESAEDARRTIKVEEEEEDDDGGEDLCCVESDNSEPSTTVQGHPQEAHNVKGASKKSVQKQLSKERTTQPAKPIGGAEGNDRSSVDMGNSSELNSEVPNKGGNLQKARKSKGRKGRKKGRRKKRPPSRRNSTSAMNYIDVPIMLEEVREDLEGSVMEDPLSLVKEERGLAEMLDGQKSADSSLVSLRIGATKLEPLSRDTTRVSGDMGEDLHLSETEISSGGACDAGSIPDGALDENERDFEEEKFSIRQPLIQPLETSGVGAENLSSEGHDGNLIDGGSQNAKFSNLLAQDQNSISMTDDQDTEINFISVMTLDSGEEDLEHSDFPNGADVDPLGTDDEDNDASPSPVAHYDKDPPMQMDGHVQRRVEPQEAESPVHSSAVCLQEDMMEPSKGETGGSGGAVVNSSALHIESAGATAKVHRSLGTSEDQKPSEVVAHALDDSRVVAHVQPKTMNPPEKENIASCPPKVNVVSELTAESQDGPTESILSAKRDTCMEASHDVVSLGNGPEVETVSEGERFESLLDGPDDGTVTDREGSAGSSGAQRMSLMRKAKLKVTPLETKDSSDSDEWAPSDGDIESSDSDSSLDAEWKELVQVSKKRSRESVKVVNVAGKDFTSAVKLVGSSLPQTVSKDSKVTVQSNYTSSLVRQEFGQADSSLHLQFTRWWNAHGKNIRDSEQVAVSEVNSLPVGSGIKAKEVAAQIRAEASEDSKSTFSTVSHKANTSTPSENVGVLPNAFKVGSREAGGNATNATGESTAVDEVTFSRTIMDVSPQVATNAHVVSSTHDGNVSSRSRSDSSCRIQVLGGINVLRDHRLICESPMTGSVVISGRILKTVNQIGNVKLLVNNINPPNGHGLLLRSQNPISEEQSLQNCNNKARDVHQDPEVSVIDITKGESCTASKMQSTGAVHSTVSPSLLKRNDVNIQGALSKVGTAGNVPQSVESSPESIKSISMVNCGEVASKGLSKYNLFKCGWCIRYFTEIKDIAEHMSKNHQDKLVEISAQKKNREDSGGAVRGISDNMTPKTSNSTPQQSCASGGEKKFINETLKESEKRKKQEEYEDKFREGHFKCKYCPEFFNYKFQWKDHHKVFHSSSSQRQQRFKRKKSERREKFSTEQFPTPPVKHNPQHKAQATTTLYVSPRNVFVQKSATDGKAKDSGEEKNSRDAVTSTSGLDVSSNEGEKSGVVHTGEGGVEVVPKNNAQHVLQNVPKHVHENVPKHVHENVPTHVQQNVPGAVIQVFPETGSRHILQTVTQKVIPNASQQVQQVLLVRPTGHQLLGQTLPQHVPKNVELCVAQSSQDAMGSVVQHLQDHNYNTVGLGMASSSTSASTMTANSAPSSKEKAVIPSVNSRQVIIKLTASKGDTPECDNDTSCSQGDKVTVLPEMIKCLICSLKFTTAAENREHFAKVHVPQIFPNQSLKQ